MGFEVVYGHFSYHFFLRPKLGYRMVAPLHTYDMVTYPGFRYTLMVPMVRWVHFLYLKPLVCTFFYRRYRMSVLKILYLHILGFRYRKCTLTIPTSSRTGTVTLLGAWCDYGMAGLNKTYFLSLIPTLVQIFKIIHFRKFWKVRSNFSHIARRDTLRTIQNNYDI